MIGYNGAANFDAFEIFISWYKEAYQVKGDRTAPHRQLTD